MYVYVVWTPDGEYVGVAATEAAAEQLARVDANGREVSAKDYIFTEDYLQYDEGA